MSDQCLLCTEEFSARALWFAGADLQFIALAFLEEMTNFDCLDRS